MNLAWSPLFFKKHEIGFALADITGAHTSAPLPPHLLCLIAYHCRTVKGGTESNQVFFAFSELSDGCLVCLAGDACFQFLL